jgi:hypothetical protein
MPNEISLDEGLLLPCWLHDGKLMQICLTNDQRELLGVMISSFFDDGIIKVSSKPICNAEVIDNAK